MSFNPRTALTAAKFIVSGVVGIGAGKIVKSVITNNVSAETLVDKVTTVAGTWAISGMVATAAKNYTDKAVDDVYDGISKMVDRIKLNEKLNRINRGETTFADEGLDEAFFLKGTDGKWKAVKEIIDNSAS